MNFKKKLKNEYNKQIQLGDSSEIKEKLSFKNNGKSFLNKGIIFSATVFSMCFILAFVIIGAKISNKSSSNKIEESTNRESDYESSEIISDSSYSYNYINDLFDDTNYEIHRLKMVNSPYKKLQTCSNVISSLDENTLELISKSGINTDVIEGYTNEYSIEETGYVSYEIPSWGSLSNVIFPGSILRIYENNTTNNFVSFGLKTAQINISASNSGDFVKVDEPNLSTTRSAISNLIKNSHVDGSTTACQTVLNTYNIHNSAELRKMIGEYSISNDIIASNFYDTVSSHIKEYEQECGVTKFDNNNNAIEKIEKITNDKDFIVVEFIQKFFEINLDTIYEPSDIISSDNSMSLIQKNYNKDGIGAYVSSISYGRKALFVFESNEPYDNVVSTTSDDNKEKLDEIISKNCFDNQYAFVVGFNSKDSLSLATSNSVEEVREVLFNEQFDTSTLVSSPISFKLSYIDGNGLVGFSNISSHYLKTLKTE